MKVEGVNFLDMPEIKKNIQNNDAINFDQYLKKALDNVNDKQIDASQATQDLITGQADSIHEVIIRAEEAKLSLELTVQIRNKMVEAYQEISRMQI